MDKSGGVVQMDKIGGVVQMDNKKQRKLKNFLMNKGVQVPLVLIVLLAGFLTSLSNAFLFYRFVKGNYDIFFYSYPDTSKDFIALMNNDLLNFGWGLIVISALITIVLAAYALVISHRLAGAGYRIQTVVDAIKAGETGARIHLRKNDDFKELAKSINELMDQIEKKG
jgi:HAMP domain-containing protein